MPSISRDPTTDTGDADVQGAMVIQSGGLTGAQVLALNPALADSLSTLSVNYSLSGRRLDIEIEARVRDRLALDPPDHHPRSPYPFDED